MYRGKHCGEISSLEVFDACLVSTSTDGAIKCFELGPLKENAGDAFSLKEVFIFEWSKAQMNLDDLLTDLIQVDDGEVGGPITDTLKWSFTPQVNGITQWAHSRDYTRSFFSSLDHSLLFYSLSLPFLTAQFTLSQVFAGHCDEITGVSFDYQNALYSISSDHHFLITNAEDLSIMQDVDCGFALSSFAMYNGFVCVAGVHYSALLFSYTQPTLVVLSSRFK